MSPCYVMHWQGFGTEMSIKSVTYTTIIDLKGGRTTLIKA